MRRVPQGSVLGPIDRFHCIPHDLFDKVEIMFDVFADDSTLWAVIDSVSNRAAVAFSLNRDLKSIQQWANTWLVTYNHGKTELVTFSRKNDVYLFRRNGLAPGKNVYLDLPNPMPHPTLFFNANQFRRLCHSRLFG